MVQGDFSDWYKEVVGVRPVENEYLDKVKNLAKQYNIKLD